MKMKPTFKSAANPAAPIPTRREVNTAFAELEDRREGMRAEQLALRIEAREINTRWEAGKARNPPPVSARARRAHSVSSARTCYG